MKIKQLKFQGVLLLFMFCFLSCSSNTDNEVIKEEKSEEPPKEVSTTITSEKDGYTINIIDKKLALNKEIKQSLIDTFHKVYYKMVAKFNADAPKKIDIVVDPTYDGVAYAEYDKATITISPDYIKGKPSDTDLLTHELMHITQSYPYGATFWLTEGIADYARHIYGTNNAAAGWSLPQYAANQNYSDGYGVSASFLMWIKNKYDDKIINKLDRNLRNETHTYISWVTNTGYTLPDLWNLYAGKPLGDKDWTIGATIKVSKENVNGVNSLEGSLKVIDGDVGSKFLVFDFPNNFWMQQELPEKQIINKYTLISGNDAEDRDPKNWTLSGSDDEQSWTVLDSRNSESFTGRNATKEYFFDTIIPYKYYRIAITANNGGTIFQLSEWRLFQKNN